MTKSKLCNFSNSDTQSFCDLCDRQSFCLSCDRQPLCDLSERFFIEICNRDKQFFKEPSQVNACDGLTWVASG